MLTSFDLALASCSLLLHACTVFADTGDGAASDWPGWAGINHLFVFGDSYSTTGFITTGAQPSPGNPLGNPEFPGATSSNGPNWVDFLTLTYNKTFLQTINLAQGGATIDYDIATSFGEANSVKYQVQSEYLPTYSQHPSDFDWLASDTLFAIWIGINDVDYAYVQSNKTDIYREDLAEYASLVDQLYQSGARNFLFLYVPPLERDPISEFFITPGQREAIKIDVNYWNSNVSAISMNLTATYADATSFVFDTHNLFDQVLDSPCTYAQTCAYENVTTYCEAYENGTPSWYTYNATCGIPVNEYFWLNSLHPTFPIQNVTAQQIAAFLA